MKKNILFLIFVTSSLIYTFAQSTITIFDDNFENYLETHDSNGNTVTLGDPSSMGNGIDNDNLVFRSRINTVTSLDISNQNINRLNGIENFISLVYLDCSFNNLSAIDLRPLDYLETLICTGNDLQFSFNFRLPEIRTNLKKLVCNQNDFNSSINMSNYSGLTYIDFSNNNLTSLNVKNGNNTNFTVFKANNNTNLYCITVDDKSYSDTNWTNIDSQTIFSENCSLLTFVPSNNFEHYLETHDADGNPVSVGSPNSMGNGTDGDNFVITSRIENVTYLNVSSKNISTLTGIKDFRNLIYLNCGSNNLTSLDVYQLYSLETLYCRNNQISTLKLPWLTNNLKRLSCRQNQLTDIDVSRYGQLTLMRFDDNNLTSLNVKNGNNNIVTTFNATGNPNLECILVDDYKYSFLNWQDKDDHAGYSENCDSQVYVPDDNFEQALIDLGYDNTLDNYVYRHQISNVTDLNVSNKNISDLTGIRSFTFLSYLNCGSNDLVHLDLRYLQYLKTLYCRNNNLSSINFSGFNRSSLQRISCRQNNFTTFNLNNFPNLTLVRFDDNQLTSFKIKNGNNSEIVTFNTTGNADLSCIEVDSASYSINNWTNIDSHTNFSEDCSQTYVPDDNFEQALINLGYDILLDNYVITSNIDTVTSLTVSNLNIADLTGIESFISLTYLACTQNQLTSINTSTLTELETLFCRDNQLTSIDLSKNLMLERLSCRNNQIELIDVHMLSNLTLLRVDDNNLNHLNVKNGNNGNILTFNATLNPNLSCIQVDDAVWSTTNWTNVDATSSFNENCYTYTYIPDDNFEQALINLGIDNYLDDYVLTQNISNISGLSINYKNISDLTGIEDFTALTNLSCYNNNLTNLDLSTNTSLEILYCNNNQLTSLDLSTNTSLTHLHCYNNQLTSLDLSTNTLLTNLLCYNNQLTSLDLSTNTSLTHLLCYNNQLTNLDLSTNTLLTSLYCNNNQLTNLDLSTNTLLTYLYCYNNQLTNLNLSTNTSLTHLLCYNNQLSYLNIKNTNINREGFNSYQNPNLYCILADNNNSYYNHWRKDTFATFSEDCSTKTYIPDTNFEQRLIILKYDSYLDNYVYTTNINDITNLNISSSNISNLTGIEDFTSLTHLYCDYNQLTNLDLSNNTLLTYLYCNNNQLTNLDLSNNTVLKNINLENNKLTSLNIKNGNNTNITPNYYFKIRNNPDLTCVEVDDSAWSTANWTYIDSQTNFNTNCYYPSIWYENYWTFLPSITKDAIIKSNYNTILNGNFTVKSLTVDTNKRLIIEPNTFVKVESNIINKGEITIEPTGSLVQIDNNATVTGTGIFKTKIETSILQDRYRFTYFSSPTENESLNVFSNWADLNYIWQFNPTLQDWQIITDTNTIMQKGKGYIIRGNSSNNYLNNFRGLTEFNGIFNNGNISQNLYFYADGNLTDNLDNDNNLLGNPYPSAIDATLLLNNNPNLGTFYFWTHNSEMINGDFSTDDYAVWNLSGGVSAVSGGTAPTGFIASGQGFFADAEGDESLSLGTEIVSTVTFSNEIRVTENNNDFRRTEEPVNDKIWLNLYNNQGVFNQILIAFLPEATIHFDKSYDGKRNGNNIATFYSLNAENQHLSIQALPLLQNETTVPLGYSVYNENINNLIISIENIEKLENTNIYLKDNLTGIIHNLKEQNYSFNVLQTGTFDSRFELLLSRNSLDNNENYFNENIIIYNTENDNIYINSTNDKMIKEVKIYDILGKVIYKSTPNKNVFEIKLPNIKFGTILFFNIKLNDYKIINKKFIKL